MATESTDEIRITLPKKLAEQARFALLMHISELGTLKRSPDTDPARIEGLELNYNLEWAAFHAIDAQMRAANWAASYDPTEAK